MAGRAVEYKCRNNKKVPHTGDRFFLDCLANGENGKFIGEVADDVNYTLFRDIRFDQIFTKKLIFQVYEGNYNGAAWMELTPECVIGCVDFPQIENFKYFSKFFSPTF